MKVDRRCPRCHGHFYHQVETPKTDNEDLMGISLERWPSESIPAKVKIFCTNCGHTWKGRLKRDERGLEDVA